GFSQEELLKIWKGIFYCMWMQDKPLLQEELANSIAQLVHTFRNLDAKFLFMETFFQTMNREWNGIDRLRLDKFYTLIRLVLRQFLEELKSVSWDDGVVSRFVSCVTKEVLNPASNTAPSGIRFHFIDIYLQELAKVGAQQLSAEQNLTFIDPFCRIAAKTKDRVLFHAISQGIFEMIADQAPFAIEDLMNELRGDEDEANSVEELHSTNEEEDSTLSPKINGSTYGKGKQLPKHGEGENLNQSRYDTDVGPVLQFDYGAIADRLFQFSSRGSTPAQNRKRLYKLVCKFRDLAEGIFPQDDFPPELSTDEEDEDFCRKKRKKKQRLAKALEGSREGGDKKKVGKGQTKKKCLVQKLPSVGGGGEEPAADKVKEEADPTEQKPPRKKKKKSRAAKIAQAPAGDLVSGDTPEFESQREENVVGENQPSTAGLGIQPVALIADSVTGPPQLKRKKRRRSRKVQAQLLNGRGLPEGPIPTEPVGKKVQKILVKLKKLQTKKLEAADQLSPSQAAGRRKGKDPAESHGNSKKLRVKSSGDAGPAVAMKSAVPDELVKFEGTPVPKPIFFKKARSAELAPRRCKMVNTMPSSSAKKVRFGLKKNTTAEFKRTDKSILVSPEGTSRIAFDPEQKPRHGVLKSNATPTCSPSLGAKWAPFTARKRPTATDFF
uniref:ribosomal RNA processing protein 1 homolog A-like n=1 Tax=Pristiophorus japonicus TaxID=55135 RepID=UPI00398F7EEB